MPFMVQPCQLELPYLYHERQTVMSATKLPVRVSYGQYEAGFNCRAHAFEFGRYIARMSGHASEISDPSGLIMQYNSLGEPSPEFAPVDPQSGPGSDAGAAFDPFRGIPENVGAPEFKPPTLEVFTNTLIAGGLIVADDMGDPMRGVSARLVRGAGAAPYVAKAYFALQAAMFPLSLSQQERDDAKALAMAAGLTYGGKSGKRIRVVLEFDVLAPLREATRDQINGGVAAYSRNFPGFNCVYAAVDHNPQPERIGGRTMKVLADNELTQGDTSSVRSHLAGVERLRTEYPSSFPAREGSKAEPPKDPTGPGRTVWKFKLPLSDKPHRIEAPGLTRIVAFAIDPGHEIAAWAEVHPGDPVCERQVIIVGTGSAVPAGMVHQGMLKDGSYIWHLYAGPVK